KWRRAAPGLEPREVEELDLDARAEPDVALGTIRRDEQLVRLRRVRDERQQQHQRLAVDPRRIAVGQRDVSHHGIAHSAMHHAATPRANSCRKGSRTGAVTKPTLKRTINAASASHRGHVRALTPSTITAGIVKIMWCVSDFGDSSTTSAR